ncbi:DNA helicase [Tanacetum coccineum]|uniref:ATP-dependent DNA helicase n=1 Tax=Tanacetum coccineum TaxID=301880 RepID=A0ABQ5AM44_9ASTR
MKTKRKLVPKSNPHTGDCNVVPLDVADRVLDVNSNVPAKRQRANGSGFISPLLIDVGPSGVQNVPPVGGPALRVSVIVKHYHTSVIPITVTRQSMEIDESSGDATHVVRVDNYSSRCPGSGMQSAIVPMFEQPELVTSIVTNRSRARRDRTRRHPTATSGSSSQQAAPLGPLLEYKDLGNCAHSCQYCGALFWFEERLKSTPRGDNSVLRRDIVEGLIDLLDTHNALVQLFRTAREKLQDTYVPNFKLRLYNVIGAREYELPTGDMLGAIVYEAGPENDIDYDIVLEERGPRYMYIHYLGALAICRVHENPLYFITFTCNVNWPEIANYMAQFPLLTTTNRADIVDRVFEMKIHQFVNYLRDAQPFGKVVADESIRPRRDEDIDMYVSAKLPAQHADLQGYRIVSELMMHRPCGLANPFTACTQNSKCKKDFPKEYCKQTYVEKSGFVHYKRRDTGVTTTRQNAGLYNRYVVPYNKQLLLAFYAHINVEYYGKYWRRRQLINKSSIRRLAYVHPAAGDLFYQRMLLCHQKGCTSFPGIRTVNEVVYPTCRDACEALGLLQDDQEWEITLQEAALTATPAELRTLLAHILAYSKVSNPKRLWERTWKSMSEDIPYVCSISFNLPNLHIEDSDLEDYMLYEFESCLNRCSKSVTNFGLHLPPEHLMSVLRNKLLMEEKSYDRRLLAIERDKLLPMLNEKQHEIFDLIVNACLNNEQQLVFVYGHGGTGKTFLWKTILHTLRSEQKIVLAVASSGIASLLLPAGRTAHSRFKIPLDLTDTSVCSIRKHTQLADLLKETCLIVWDESPMNDRRCFETLDRTLRDILDQPNHLFGGKTVMLGGDFRQTLPVKRGASRNEIIRYSIANSYLWPHFKIHYLTENMRLSNKNLSEVDKHRTAVFAQWLLDIGNGNIGIPDDSDQENTSWVDIPDEYCIPNDDNGLTNLINFIYDDDTLHHPSAQKLQEKAIICPKNDMTDVINNKILSLLTTTTRTYLSYDEAIPHGHDGGEVELLYPKEYLNSLSFTGLPPHKLTLKVGAPIMLLRNINITGGLCNGTRLIVSQLLPKVIEARIITGTKINQKVFIPRIPLTMKDPRTPFIFKRKQFPVKVCYAMTINKAQGQSLKKIGVHLPEPVFGHGQLLMATTSYPDTTAKNKGKMIVVQTEISDIASLKPTDSNKVIEVIVYRKWISKHVHSRQPIRFCCILLDRQGTPIQANMDAQDTNYFDHLLQLHSAYRITGFSCEQTGPWERTLENPTSLTFGKFITLQEIPNDNFPEHYFNFISYNELPTKLNVRNSVLTACGKQVIPGNPVPTCKNHGPQPTPTHSYCFKAIIGDGSGTIPITCFSNQANALVKDCNELLTELSTRNPYELPSILKDLEGTARIFQFHFEINSTSKRKDFVLDKVFEKTMLPLPAPPIQNATVEHITTEQPKPVALLETSSPALSTTGTNEFNLQKNITDPLQQSPTTRPPPEHSTKDQEENQPTDLPALVTKETTYNVNLRADMPKFDTQEAPTATPIEFQPSQSTPPQIENPIEADKEKPPTNTTRASARKSLFIDTPETHSPQAGKKSKRDK